MNIEKMREEFEAWAWRYHNDEGDWFQSDELMLAKYDNGEYVVYWLNKEWLSWKASRAALVIELPVINERDWAVTSDECAAMREGIEIMARRVESAGLKVGRPPKAAEPERTCPGCGEKGFTANCMQCIPY